MDKPVSISLKAFTSSVQAAVKAAAAKHPKFNLPVPKGVSVSYLIRGIPVPDEILAKVTVAETQAFAGEVAAHLAKAQAGGLVAGRPAAQAGAVFSFGGHVIIGIPVPPEIMQFDA
jgi:hypothetical protein